MPPLRTPFIILALALIPSAPVAAQDKVVADAAKELFDGRATATEAATELKRTHRASDGDIVWVLASVGYRAPDLALAATEALRADPSTAAGLMSAAGMTAVDIAGGLNRGIRVTGARALDALDGARVQGVADPAVYRAVGGTADELASWLQGKGEPAHRTASVLMDVHGMSADVVARPLLTAYDPRAVGTALKDALRFDGDKVRSTLLAEGVVSSVVDSVLRDLGLAPAPPGVLRWWIRDYAMGTGPNDLIENAEIVDRSSVLQGASSVDGVVWIEGPNLNHPDVEVWAGTTGPAPVMAEVRTRQSLGGTDRLEVLFPSMPAAGFRVVTPGGEAEVGAQAWPVGYAAIDRDLFETALEGLSVSVGSEVVVQISGRTITMLLPEHRENGIEVNVLDMNNNGFAVSTEEEPGGAALVISIPFEESGREIDGHFFGYIPCWTCGSFEIPQAECSVLTIDCALGFLSASLASLGTCANPANWEETEVLDLNGLPFEGDLANTSLMVRMGMAVSSSGLGSTGTTYDFQTNVSISTNSGNVDVGVVDPIVRQRVSGQLNAAMAEIDLAQSAVDALNQYAAVLGFGTYLSMEPMPNGRLFVSFPAD